MSADKKAQQLIEHIGFDVHKEANKLWKIIEKQHKASKSRLIIKMPALVIHKCNRRTSSGICYYNKKTVSLSLGRDTVRAWVVLAHELNHAAGYIAHDRAFYHALKAITEARWKTRISFYEVGRYGYAVDAIIEEQLNKAGSVQFKSPARSPILENVE